MGTQSKLYSLHACFVEASIGLFNDNDDVFCIYYCTWITCAAEHEIYKAILGFIKHLCWYSSISIYYDNEKLNGLWLSGLVSIVFGSCHFTFQ